MLAEHGRSIQNKRQDCPVAPLLFATFSLKRKATGAGMTLLSVVSSPQAAEAASLNGLGVWAASSKSLGKLA